MPQPVSLIVLGHALQPRKQHSFTLGSRHHKGLPSKHWESRHLTPGKGGLVQPLFSSTHFFKGSCSLKDRPQTLAEHSSCLQRPHVPTPMGQQQVLAKRPWSHQHWEVSFHASVHLHVLFPPPRMSFLLFVPDKLLLFPQCPMLRSSFLCEVFLLVVSFVPPLSLYTFGL